MLCFTVQRYKIESNSQRLWKYVSLTFCCVLPCKDTKLKAIHNKLFNIKHSDLLCFTVQRYKIESNSQPSVSPFVSDIVVFYRAKIQN